MIYGADTIRAFFAGSWYPSDRKVCEDYIERLMDRVSVDLPNGAVPVGGILPHAGWDFSGRVAAGVIKALSQGPTPDTVVIFGGHEGTRGTNRMIVRGRWETPLGPLGVDGQLAQGIARVVRVEQQDPSTAEPDNTIELQLPFVKHVFPSAMILPIVCTPTDEGLKVGQACAQAARTLSRRIIVLGSTDLTHYGSSYGFSPVGVGPESERWVREVNDSRVIDRMLDMDEAGVIEEALKNQNACCPGAAAAAIRCVKTMGAKGALRTAYATSRDVLPADDFVGYVGIVYWI